MLGQALDHGRRREQRDAPMRAANSSKISAGSKPPLAGIDLAGGLRRVRQDVAARAVRHRRGMHDRIAGRDLVDVGEVASVIASRLRWLSIAPLGRPGGAAGVEQPGDVVRRHLGHRRRIAREQGAVLGAADLDDALADPSTLALERRDRLDQIRRDEADARAGMVEDVGELARVQLGVDRHHGEAGVPAGEQQLDVVGHVAHHQRHPVARREAERRAQAARPSPRRAARSSP